jgi:hypothetical protein
MLFFLSPVLMTSCSPGFLDFVFLYAHFFRFQADKSIFLLRGILDRPVAHPFFLSMVIGDFLRSKAAGAYS